MQLELRENGADSTGGLSIASRLSETLHPTRSSQAVAMPKLSNPVRIPYGPFRFEFQLPAGLPYTVEASRDLKKWESVWKHQAKGEIIQCVDSAAYKYAHRFYRLRAGVLFSENVVGYAIVNLPPGFSMIANPFLNGQTVSELFAKWPNGTLLSRFDTNLFKLVENRIEKGKWLHPEARLAPGEGALFLNPTDQYKTINFTGEVPLGHVSMPVPSGFCIRGALLPVPGALDELGFPVSDGDVIHTFDAERQKYELHPFENGKWTGGIPRIGIGESFWVAKSKPAVWAAEISPFELSVDSGALGS